MRLTTRPRRPSKRIAPAAGPARNPVVRAVLRGVAAMTGRRRRDAVRARERFEGLEFDQRVREVGEW